MKEDCNSMKGYVQAESESEKFMDLRVDFAFKYIFSIKENLIKFLNDILPHQITDLTYLGNEIPVMSSKDKRSRLDVLCESTEGKFIVEMQRRHEKDFDDRLAYYASVMVKNQVSIGRKKRKKKLYKVKHVYVLCVVDYLRRHQESTPDDKVLFNYYYCDIDNREIYTDGKISYHFLELNRFKEEDWDKLQKNPERWCYMFKNLHNFAKSIEIPSNLHGFDGIVDDAMLDALDEQQQMKYKKDKDFLEYQILTTSLAAYDDGKAEGKAEGRAEGKAEGREERSIEIAKNMKSMGLNPTDIAKATNLSEDRIAVL